MPYQPIENYGIIGNMRTVALIAMNGSIDWYCYPNFDSPSIFGAIQKDQDSFFRFSEIAFIATDKAIHFCGTLDELPTFLAGGKYQFTPEYWWPADHSWCVCSDYDLTFTIVAGSKELVSGGVE